MIPCLRSSPLAFPAALSLVLPVAFGCTVSHQEARVAIELEAEPNTLDGCTACGCRAVGDLAPGSESRWWVAFGLVRAAGDGRWEASAASTHCGQGDFEALSSDFVSTVGVPYLLLDLEASPALGPAGEIDLSLDLSFRKLSGFGGDGQPSYTQSADERRFSFAEQGDFALPLLVPDEAEARSFRIHEVVLGLSVSLVGGGPAAAFGGVSVSADVPGAEILLDGGAVGRIAEGSPTLIQNVLAGERDIRVRDFSGREAARQVTVDANQTVDVALEILGLTRGGPRGALIPVGENRQGAEEFWRVRDGALVVWIPAGEFLRGSLAGDGEPDERPQHRVYISDFLIDKTEISWRQFRKFAEAKGRPLPPSPLWGMPDDYPASFILWQEAADYCDWVGGRLPTEAEWEKAARGTDGRRYPWGNAWDATRCNSISGGLHRPEGVGRYPACLTPYGALDMSGSMWEWCADHYATAYYAESPGRDPRGPGSGGLRVMRGGAWMTQPAWLRAAYRFKASPASRNADHGFRCAMDALE